LVEALDRFSQRLPVTDGQAPSLVLGRVSRSRSRSRAGSRSGVSKVAEPADPVSSRPDSRPREGLSSIWRLRGLMDRLVARRDPSRPGHDDPDDGLPSRQFLRGANGIQAAVWIAARLAEGLDHAHSRGLLHRDLKPANVLIAADGTPMLLDFNLAVAADPGQEPGAEGFGRALLGGTLPYMSPEHLLALDPDGSTPPEAVDERSDLYAMGLILFEMIAGSPPFPEPPGGVATLQTVRTMVEDRCRTPLPSLRARCPEVPWSLDALVAQCLQPDPSKRYACARDLADDLRRFLDDLPMKHCPEPSLRERLGKWARRHPGLCGSTSIAIISVILLGLLGGLATFGYEALQGVAARVRLQELDRHCMESQFLLGLGTGHDDLKKQGVKLARATLEQVGIMERAAVERPRSGRGPRRSGNEGARWVDRLTPKEQQRVWRQVVDLMLLSARAGVDLARDGPEDERRQALERAVWELDRAERIQAPPPSALFGERARYHAALGNAEPAARDRARAARLAPTTSQDFAMLGKVLLANRAFGDAEAALREAIRRDVSSFWAWYYLGHCHYELGRYLESAADFNACFLGGLKFPWVHFNRGLALARAGRLLDARVSYDHAIELDPDFTLARFNRGLVELELDLPDEALADLHAAVARGCREVGVLTALGEALARLGRREEAEETFRGLLEKAPHDPLVRVARGMTRLRVDAGRAREDFAAVLEDDPRNAMAHYGMARVVRARDHRLAIEHLNVALEANPDLIDALQLRALERARLGDRATLDDVDLLVKAPTSHRLYNAACALAVYAETAHDPAPLDRAVQLLSLALRAGFPAREAARDPDLKPLQGRPDFATLMGRFLGGPARTTGGDGARPGDGIR
jgi:tetratricopeptide (TPR) repeat protein